MLNVLKNEKHIKIVGIAKLNYRKKNLINWKSVKQYFVIFITSFVARSNDLNFYIIAYVMMIAS